MGMNPFERIGPIGRTCGYLNRIRQIGTTIVRYGFVDWFHLTERDLLRSIGFLKSDGQNLVQASPERRLRMALQELGPTFIKMGQLLSTRPDLVSMKMYKELEALQDNVPPSPPDRIVKTIKSDFGVGPERLFAVFEKEPIAAASIGQVHRAWMKNGREVAVKVQRPGVQRIIRMDIDILFSLAWFMERYVPEAGPYQPLRIVEEFSKVIQEETDYGLEADNMERFSRCFSEDPTLFIPKVHRDISSPRVLTMDFVHGLRVSGNQWARQNGDTARVLAHRWTTFFFKQFFDHGFFHADPHPGNFLILPGNIICMLDFGMMGQVEPRLREDFIDLAESLLLRNQRKAVRVLLRITQWNHETNPILLEKEFASLMDTYLKRPCREIHLGRMFQDLMELLYRCGLRVPPDFYIMMKTFGMAEGVGRRLDPELDLLTQFSPFIARVKAERFTPGRLIADLLHLTLHLLDRITEVQKDVSQEASVSAEMPVPCREIKNTPPEKARLNVPFVFTALSICIAAGMLLMMVL